MIFRPSPLRYEIVALVAIAVAIAGAFLLSDRHHRPEKAVPRSITADCSRPVDAELSAFIAGVPDGTTINFPHARCYAQTGSIELKTRNGLTVDGHGTTFRSSAPNDNSKLAPQWLLNRSHDITLRNFTAVGNFHDPGPPSPTRGAVTSNAGVAVLGSTEVLLRDLKIRDVFGDGVILGNSAYHDYVAPAEYPKNVRLDHLSIDRAARHCVSTSQATGFWLEDSTLSDCYADGVDLEKDVVSDTLTDLHILNNRISNYFAVGVVAPIGDPRENPVTTIEIKGNRFPTLSIASICDQPIVIGNYPDQYFNRITIQDNEMVSWRVAIEVARILGGSIAHNKITHPREARREDCGPQHEDNVVQIDSPNLSISNRSRG